MTGQMSTTLREPRVAILEMYPYRELREGSICGSYLTEKYEVVWCSECYFLMAISSFSISEVVWELYVVNMPRGTKGPTGLFKRHPQ